MSRIQGYIRDFLEAVPEVRNGDPSKDFIDESALFEVAEEFAAQLNLITRRKT